MNYFGIAVKYNDAVEVDHWLRRRVRMCHPESFRDGTERRNESAN
jgi:hypothetical protein